MNLSQNAIYAKAHALYSKRLRNEDYIIMASFTGLRELLNYLSAETSYSEAFGNFKSELSTDQIEEQLQNYMFTVIEKISRYSDSQDSIYTDYLTVNNDISQIISFLRLLIAGNQGNYLHKLPPFLVRHCSINLYEIAKSDSFPKLLEALSGTEYYKILSPFLNIEDLGSVLTVIESSLFKYKKNYLPKIAGRNDEVSDIIKTKLDFDFICALFRLTSFDSTTSEIIKKNMTPETSAFSEKELSALTDAVTRQEIYSIIFQSTYRKAFEKTVQGNIEAQTSTVFREKLFRYMRYSNKPDTVMLSYLLILENEINSVKQIAEGIKYKLPADKILSVLHIYEGGAKVGN